MKTIYSILALSLLLTNIAFAHGGRTNASGCHNDNVNGGYHCHNGGSKYKSRTTQYTPTKTRSTSPAKVTSKSLIRETQKRLNLLGYTAGVADGIMGANTRGALKRFQKDNSIPTTGKPSYSLLTILKSGSRVQ